MATVAIFGASGNIGYELIKSISDKGIPSGTTSVKAVTRDPDGLRNKIEAQGKKLPDSVLLVKGDVTDAESVSSALSGTSRAFLCLPQALSSADMIKTTKSFNEAAAKVGCRVIIRISSLGIDGGAQGPLGAAHVEGESHARGLGLTLTSIRPTSFSSNFVAYDLASVRDNNSFASPLGTEAAVNWVHVSDIARVSFEAIFDSKHDGATLEVTGPESSTLTAGKMAQILSDKTGSAVSYNALPPPEGEGDYPSLWAFLRGGGFAKSTGMVKSVTGSQPLDFADWVVPLLAKN